MKKMCDSVKKRIKMLSRITKSQAYFAADEMLPSNEKKAASFYKDEGGTIPYPNPVPVIELEDVYYDGTKRYLIYVQDDKRQIAFPIHPTE